MSHTLVYFHLFGVVFGGRHIKDAVCCVTFMIYRCFRPAAICLAVVTENTDVTQADLGKCRAAKT